MDKRNDFKYQVILSTDGKLTIMGGTDDITAIEQVYDKLLPTFKKMIAVMKENGIEKKSFGGGAKKEKNWTGEKCPLCGLRLHHITYQKDGETKDGVACEGSLYDYKTKTKSGCKFFGFGKTLKEHQAEQARKASVSSFNSEYGQA